MLPTKYKLKDQEAILAKMEKRQAELTDARESFDKIDKKAKEAGAEIRALQVDTKLPMSERKETYDNLQTREARFRAELGPPLEVIGGNRQAADEELEALAPQVEEAKAYLAQLKRDYGRTRKKFPFVYNPLKKLQRHAARIDDLIADLGVAVEGFWRAHQDIQKPALKIGAKRNRGFGTILETSVIDGILHAILWPIFRRSMMPERPANGGGGSLLAAVPQTAGQLIGEDPPEPDKKKAA